MRKYIFLMLSLLLVLGLAAQADTQGTQDLKGTGTDNPPSGEMQVKLELKKTYTFTIPGVGDSDRTITLTGGGARENVGSLGVSEVILLPGESLKVSVESENHYQMLSDTHHSLDYSLEFWSLGAGRKELNKDSSTGPIEIFTYTPAAGGLGEESRTVYVTVAPSVYPGLYTDQLTFTAEIVEPAPKPAD